MSPSYVAVSAQVGGTAAKAATERRVSKYAGLSASHIFIPIAMDILGPMNEAKHFFLSEMSRHLSTISDDPRVVLSLPAFLNSYTEVQ